MTVQQPLDRFETELLAELRAVVTTAAAEQETTTRPPRWRRPAISVGLAAAAAAAVLLATSGVGPGSTPSAPASEVLLTAARHAESTSAATDGTYWHVRTVEAWDDGKLKGTLDEQTWRRKDGATWSSDNGAAVAKREGGFVLCDKGVDFAALQALPTDPGALRNALEDAMLNNDDGPVPADARESFVTSCTVGLLTMPVSPEVRGAAFRSLAALPDTENLGRTTDREGRVGTELVFGDGDGRQNVIIDPGSGALLQFDYAGTGGRWQGTVLDAGWTDTLQP
jgi:hypothetical protein